MEEERADALEVAQEAQEAPEEEAQAPSWRAVKEL
jgi:hypothetical protein